MLNKASGWLVSLTPLLACVFLSMGFGWVGPLISSVFAVFNS
jgi:hypothetical protein